jgi:hypothetical protein
MTQFLQLINLTYEDYVLATRSTIRSIILFHKRTSNKLRVNYYNVHCLKAWRASIDIQFALDVYALQRVSLLVLLQVAEVRLSYFKQRAKKRKLSAKKLQAAA